MELTIFAEIAILLTLLVIKFALDINEFVLVTAGNFCKTTSPVALTVKNLVAVCMEVAL